MEILEYNKIIDFMQKWEKIIEDFENEKEGVEFNFEQFREESREIGKMLNAVAGFDLMMLAHNQMPANMKRIVELSWSGIGKWMG